ncbi:MAG: hypothetical protein ACHQX3_09390 [Nitrospirales bacterium]
MKISKITETTTYMEFSSTDLVDMISARYPDLFQGKPISEITFYVHGNGYREDIHIDEETNLILSFTEKKTENS